MATPYLGEIRMVGFNFAPQGWAFCNGQLLSISQYTALFSILGTYYGGNGTTTFALPNLQSRAPIHQGQGRGSHPITLVRTPVWRVSLSTRSRYLGIATRRWQMQRPSIRHRQRAMFGGIRNKPIIRPPAP